MSRTRLKSLLTTHQLTEVDNHSLQCYDDSALMSVKSICPNSVTIVDGTKYSKIRNLSKKSLKIFNNSEIDTHRDRDNHHSYGNVVNSLKSVNNQR